MSDYRRAIIPGGVFFFTVVTHERTPIFVTGEQVDRLREAFRKVRMSRPFVIDAMVVLPDHLHCIWRLPEGDGDYSGRWREIKKAASRAIAPRSNVRCERVVWQRRFWEHAIRDEEDWHRHLDYIHYNPVKHGLVARTQDWVWSSFERCVARGWYEASWGRRNRWVSAGWISSEGVGGCAALIHPTLVDLLSLFTVSCTVGIATNFGITT